MRLAAALALLLAAARPAAAATLRVEVRDARGAPVADAVVYAIPDGKKIPPPTRHAVLDQKNRTFVPHVLPVQVGTAVRFPNSDNVRHQVYSFSAAKSFQLPLYSGTPAAPVVFDRPGVVSLGCNIHDRMSAYIVVVDTPHFAAAADGRAELSNLPEGQYAVRVWYAGMRREPASQTVTLGASEQKDAAFRIGNP
jgi:plastocyanin